MPVIYLSIPQAGHSTNNLKLNPTLFVGVTPVKTLACVTHLSLNKDAGTTKQRMARRSLHCQQVLKLSFETLSDVALLLSSALLRL
jgi:hypothetical protein